MWDQYRTKEIEWDLNPLGKNRRWKEEGKLTKEKVEVPGNLEQTREDPKTFTVTWVDDGKSWKFGVSLILKVSSELKNKERESLEEDGRVFINLCYFSKFLSFINQTVKEILQSFLRYKSWFDIFVVLSIHKEKEFLWDDVHYFDLRFLSGFSKSIFFHDYSERSLDIHIYYT